MKKGVASAPPIPKHAPNSIFTGVLRSEMAASAKIIQSSSCSPSFASPSSVCPPLSSSLPSSEDDEITIKQLKIKKEKVNSEKDKESLNVGTGEGTVHFSHLICEECEISKATMFCPQCEVKYCRDCNQSIHSKKVFRHHLIVPIDDSLSLPKTDQSTPSPWSHPSSRFCPNHSKYLLEFFCQDCEIVFCSCCLIEKHKTHSFTLSQDTFKQLEPQLNSILLNGVEERKAAQIVSDEMNLTLKTLEKSLQMTESVLAENPNLLRASRECKWSSFLLDKDHDSSGLLCLLSTHFKELHANIDRSHQILLKEYHQILTQRISSLKSRSEELDQAIKTSLELEGEYDRLKKMMMEKYESVIESESVEKSESPYVNPNVSPETVVESDQEDISKECTENWKLLKDLKSASLKLRTNSSKSSLSSLAEKVILKLEPTSLETRNSAKISVEMQHDLLSKIREAKNKPSSSLMKRHNAVGSLSKSDDNDDDEEDDIHPSVLKDVVEENLKNRIQVLYEELHPDELDELPELFKTQKGKLSTVLKDLELSKSRKEHNENRIRRYDPNSSSSSYLSNKVQLSLTNLRNNQNQKSLHNLVQPKHMNK